MTVGFQDLMAASGISYRQLQYWCRTGYLRPENPRCGSGTAFVFPPGEVRVAQVMGRLTRAGLVPEAAHHVARGGQLPENVQVTFLVPKPEEKEVK